MQMMTDPGSDNLGHLQPIAIIALDARHSDPGATALAQRRRQLVRHLEFTPRDEPRVPITLDTLNRAHDAFTDHWDTYAKSARTHRQREDRDLRSVFLVNFQTLFAPYIAKMGGLQNMSVAPLRIFTHVIVGLTQF